jgi:hypothetical protein
MNQRAKHSNRPEVDKRWQGRPRRHSPSSSKLDSMTNGGDKDVTTRNTDRALVDKPETTISPPGLHGKQDGAEGQEERFMRLHGGIFISLHLPYDRVQVHLPTQHQSDTSPFRALGLLRHWWRPRCLLLARHQIQDLEV